MPTVLRAGNFAFHIYPNDHEPAHVHAYNADGWCKVEIATEAVIKVVGMRTADAKEASRIVKAHRALLTRRWEQIHG